MQMLSPISSGLAAILYAQEMAGRSTPTKLPLA